MLLTGKVKWTVRSKYYTQWIGYLASFQENRLKFSFCVLTLKRFKWVSFSWIFIHEPPDINSRNGIKRSRDVTFVKYRREFDVSLLWKNHFSSPISADQVSWHLITASKKTEREFSPKWKLCYVAFLACFRISWTNFVPKYVM